MCWSSKLKVVFKPSRCPVEYGVVSISEMMQMQLYYGEPLPFIFAQQDARFGIEEAGWDTISLIIYGFCSNSLMGCRHISHSPRQTGADCKDLAQSYSCFYTHTHTFVKTHPKAQKRNNYNINSSFQSSVSSRLTLQAPTATHIQWNVCTQTRVHTCTELQVLKGVHMHTHLSEWEERLYIIYRK